MRYAIVSCIFNGLSRWEWLIAIPSRKKISLRWKNQARISRETLPFEKKKIRSLNTIVLSREVHHSMAIKLGEDLPFSYFFLCKIQRVDYIINLLCATIGNNLQNNINDEQKEKLCES